MFKIRSARIKHLVNRLRGIPVEWDLAPYRKTLSRVARYRFESTSDKILQQSLLNLKDSARKGEPLDDLLPEVYALVSEAAVRTVGLRPFDVQVIAGIILHEDKVAEMDTGEGKTLAAVMPAALSALTGRGVHVYTFNDYLARRDAAWMGPIYSILGLSVGCIQEGMPPAERKKAYAADITYATAKEAGFDYLRDQLAYREEDIVHRPFHFAVIDEADSILIDEARVPLVIAGSTGRPPDDPLAIAERVRALRWGEDYETDEGRRNVFLTEAGIKRLEEEIGCDNLHAEENLDLITRIHHTLHAEVLLRRDVEYIIREGRVEIVDEFTGRVVEDRHWPDGLQAAVEAKENLRRGAGGRILGSITLQHYLGLFPKLAGMTATARPTADEQAQFYGLRTVVVPPHRPCLRVDHPDVLFTHLEAKRKRLVEEIRRVHDSGRPLLVGTVSVEESERLTSDLKKAGVACEVLNAKNDEREADIIAQAGRPGAVTISTNMAGRGTDIKLGGADEKERERVVALGGLYVIGTNRHESLRFDRQLRGRAGRQGDPGESRFFVSLEDPLIERHGIRSLFPKSVSLLRQEGPLGNPIVRREIDRGQRIIEGQNFEIRKTLRKYSEIIERQRSLVAGLRLEVLKGESLPVPLSESDPERWSRFSSLQEPARMKEVEKRLALQTIDRCWADHLALVADIREGIHLESVGGKTPLVEFHQQVARVFLELEEKIEDALLEAFRALPLTAEPLDFEKLGLRGPSSTWTYLISDSQFGSWVGLLHGSNIGATAAAALFNGPLYLAMVLLQRFYKKKKH